VEQSWITSPRDRPSQAAENNREDTIFAREVKRGNDTFVFRDKDGNPIW